MRSREGAVDEPHFPSIFTHQRDKHCHIGLSVLVGQVKAAEVPADLLFENKTSEVVGDGECDIVGRSDYQCEQRFFQSEDSVLLRVNWQSNSSHFVICLHNKQIEGGNTDEILLDNLVGSVEGE
jgi:hypothetical protein